MAFQSLDVTLSSFLYLRSDSQTHPTACYIRSVQNLQRSLKLTSPFSEKTCPRKKQLPERLTRDSQVPAQVGAHRQVGLCVFPPSQIQLVCTLTGITHVDWNQWVSFVFSQPFHGKIVPTLKLFWKWHWQLFPELRARGSLDCERKQASWILAPNGVESTSSFLQDS